jgi:biotin carboxyl carrier protein
MEANPETASQESHIEKPSVFEKPSPLAVGVPGDEKGLLPIKAPMLGTLYRRPSPKEPPFVEVGTFVNETDTVCLLEVMKVFNTVTAGVKGYIQKICVESETLVEFGQVLFWVRPGERESGGQQERV